jgi:hypothetical protein
MNLQRKVYRMNWPKLKSGLGRTALVVGVTGALLGGVGAAAAQAALGTEPGDVALSEVSGSTNDTPTWSTTVGCNAGFQGSAVFRVVTASGGTFSISGAVPTPTSAFSGSLLGPISEVQEVSGVPNGGSTELVVVCFSGASETGSSDPEMDEYIQFSADGTTFITQDTPFGTQVPVGEIGGLVFAGLAALGLGYMQLRRRSRRTRPSLG